MDETYVLSFHASGKSWSDDRRETIIVHAGGENGVVKNSVVSRKDRQSPGDCRYQMSSANHIKWLHELLIPDLSFISVLVIDNALYHCVRVNKMSTSKNRKDQRTSWLSVIFVQYV
ncbi:hypothetical protein PR048_020363 [Dryococelus australis]|uniref:Tc1-like transposase DDE domain-containing protein n=1 Tax=Dryococelus australis TaxID=614101 RepID=A0ABQ9H622_9NEOP|nr:hypothetical protein PR048_020363 [Dryococelus australis]